MKKVTFRPLGRGKFRCYVDGKITKYKLRKKNCESIRNQIEKGDIPSVSPENLEGVM